MKRFILTDRFHHNLLEKQIGKTGLHRSQHAALLFIKLARAEVNQKTLADFFEISSAAVTALIKRLEANGYITKTADKADMRKNVLRLTDKGDEILKKSKKLADEVDNKMFEGFSPKELEEFCKCLDKIYSNLENFEKD